MAMFIEVQQLPLRACKIIVEDINYYAPYIQICDN
jgi:hypothetical protein